MRNDWAKVVTERPRAGSWRNYKNSGYRARDRREEEESAVKYRAMKAGTSSRWGEKEFRDLISPLYRLLRSSVGKDWDNFYSQISVNLPIQGLQGFHIRTQHLDKMVCVRPWFEGGVYSEPPKYSRRPTEFGTNDFYVDVAGILREGKTPVPRYTRPRPKPQPIIKTSDGRPCEKIDGIWYAMVYREVRGPDGVLYLSLVRKNQLNSRDLKRSALKND